MKVFSKVLYLKNLTDTALVQVFILALLVAAVAATEPAYPKPSYPAYPAPTYPKTEYVSWRIFAQTVTVTIFV
jgi:hypothetical protein